MLRLLRSVVACLLVVVVTGAIATTPNDEDSGAPPLQLEDVVRRFVSGSSADELIGWIRSSEVEFDRAQEMLRSINPSNVAFTTLIELLDPRDFAKTS